jgi:HAD superfamily hydrolase (TIGR01484 family)
MYVYDDSWKMIYDDSLTEEEKKKIIDVIQGVLDMNLVEKPQNMYGEQIEDRESEITISYLGQQAPVSLKHAWDPDLSKRRLLLSHIEPLLPEFSVKTGGSTSIDVVKKGRDKAYGITKLSDYLHIPIDDMCYLGDALYEGGNDEVVKKTGIDCVSVKDETETLALLKEIILQ